MHASSLENLLHLKIQKEDLKKKKIREETLMWTMRRPDHHWQKNRRVMTEAVNVQNLRNLKVADVPPLCALVFSHFISAKITRRLIALVRRAAVHAEKAGNELLGNMCLYLYA